MAIEMNVILFKILLFLNTKRKWIKQRCIMNKIADFRCYSRSQWGCESASCLLFGHHSVQSCLTHRCHRPGKVLFHLIINVCFPFESLCSGASLSSRFGNSWRYLKYTKMDAATENPNWKSVGGAKPPGWEANLPIVLWRRFIVNIHEAAFAFGRKRHNVSTVYFDI